MTWDKGKPAGSQKIRLSDEEIRANQAALEDTLVAEHYFPNTGHDGVHKIPVGAGAPTGYEGRLAIVNNLLEWYSNGQWRTSDATPIAPGTVMLFMQAAAPVGWTQVVTQNDRVLRVVSGGGGATGGDWTLTGITVQGHALTVDELAVHQHSSGTGAGGCVAAGTGG